MNDIMAEYRVLFLEEAEEHITAVNENLIALEKHRDERKLVDNIFRSAHTLKSSAAAVGLTRMSALAHKAEDLMQKVRNGEIPVTDAVISALFAAFDTIKECCQAVQEGRDGEAVDTARALEELAAAMAPRQAAEAGTAEDPTAVSADLPLEVSWAVPTERLDLLRQRRSVFQIDIRIDHREPLKWLRAELLINKLSKSCVLAAIHPDKAEFLRPDFDGVFSLLVGTDLPEDALFVEASLDLIQGIRLTRRPEFEAEESSAAAEDGRPKQAEAVPERVKARSADTIRVAVEKLDALMNLIGELATTISGIRQIERRAREENASAGLLADLSSFEDKLTSLSSDLQYSIMVTRLLPVSTVFGQFNRVVRDTAQEMGKKVSLILQGEETELDKKIIDALSEPLMHLVRNAIDHGIEPSEERRRLGKREEAAVILSAGRVGNHIVVSVRDDGRGMDERRILAKAVEKGLVDKDAAAQLTPAQIRQFVFLPGFSTSEKVSSISGRGVGLDVVKTVVTGLNGSVEVWSEPGRGTEFQLVLPLTLTTTSVILCRSGGALYAIPINDIMESLALHPEMVRWVDGRRMVFLREEILPLVDLEEIFEGRSRETDAAGRKVIVVFYKDKRLGVVVDTIEGTDEIVLKNLERHYKAVPGLSGAAILGDGRIALALDTLGLVGLLKRRLEADTRRTEREEVPVNAGPAAGGVVGSDRGSDTLPGGLPQRIKAIFDESFQEAAASLSQLTGKPMMFGYTSELLLLSPEDLVNRLHDDMATPCYGSLIRSDHGLRSDVLLLVEEGDGPALYTLLTGQKPADDAEGREEVLMAIGEVNNILSSSFINHVANAVRQEIHPTTPSNRFDMLGAMVQSAVLLESEPGKKILCADTLIAEKGGRQLKSRMFVVTDGESLARLLPE